MGGWLKEEELVVLYFKNAHALYFPVMGRMRSEGELFWLGPVAH